MQNKSDKDNCKFITYLKSIGIVAILGEIRCNITVNLLISWHYHLKNYSISGSNSALKFQVSECSKP